ncbi:MAG: hypothetical protein OEV92_12680, partial [Nitrospinota bacterium]|nr:hypothetical protein [Nitrospinota bacterium]
MRETQKRNLLAPVISALALAILAGMVASCGDIKVDTSQLNPGASNTSSDLSGAGVTPNPTWHNSYFEGPHGGFLCTDCHVSVARTDGGKSPFREISGNQICANCHMDKYNRTTFFNHQVTKAGTHCNSCHYSDSFRSRTRISHTQYHQVIGGSCDACHTG